MKKKIIFVTKALWIGGIETALVNLINRMDPRKYDITCLILQDEKPMAKRLPAYCRLLVADREHTVSFPETYRFSRLFHLTEEPENPSRMHRAMMWLVPAIKWIENRLYIRYIRKQLQNEHFDTCIIYSDVAAETAVRAVNAEKFLLFYHHGAMRCVYHDEIGYRRSEKIIAVSRHQAEKLCAFRPKYAHKIVTVHNLVDAERIREKGSEPVQESFLPERFNIVSCGRVSREKGMDLAVEACAKLVAAGYKHIHWWIVGGGPAEAEVREKIAQLGMEQYMTMLGMQENPYPYIDAADLYVQPSRFEAFGLTIAEALVLEKPVLSTDNGGAGEILQPGITGILCPISPEGIAEAVEGLLSHPESLKRLRENVCSRDPDEENRTAIGQLEEYL